MLGVRVELERRYLAYHGLIELGPPPDVPAKAYRVMLAPESGAPSDAAAAVVLRIGEEARRERLRLPDR